MKTYHRNFLFESNDFKELCNFIVQENAKKKDSFIWHIGRIVDWKYNLSDFRKHFPDKLQQSCPFVV